ncbi:MFS general substrate transporter [Aspergillus steynii IBT 23096]|uniref:MFS general substrate transporter n=1 Tax=Aspergillus steynii IBT 23096 TaxID=1392250 RepID=A0A2I2FWW9_9EURO|nr:MFS general substrate transporter [Aspergillus steynii IBT 23096]PLB45056.1 MFS general substrate transporter [Aspergillus steynii IBT 23096]
MSSSPNNDKEDKHSPEIEQIENSDRGVAQLSKETQIGKVKALRKYTKSILWCIYGAWCLILASFENLAGGQVIGIPQFRKDFGHVYAGNYVLDGSWQSAINGAPVAAVAIGTLGAAYLADKIGRKYTLLIGLVIGYVGITLEVTAKTIELFFVGKFINGVAIGTHTSVAVSYVGEIAPLALRGVMTAICAFAFTFGPFIGAIIMNYTSDTDGRWAYRALFSSQYGFAVIATVVWPFMPESPWWLLSVDKDAAAAKSLNSLGIPGDEIPTHIARIKATLSMIRDETEGVTYMECFRLSNLRRTIISIAPMSFVALSGVYFIGSYFTYYAQLAGYTARESFQLQIAQQTLSMFGNILSWFVIDRVGRRDLTFWGLVVLTIVLMIAGGLGTLSEVPAIKGVIALELFYVWCFNLTVGSTAFTLLAETATSRLRVKSIAISVALQNGLFTMWAFVIPFIFNPDKANLGAKTAFIFGGISVLCIVYVWFYQPETAGRSYAELDEMFMKRVPARKFKTYKTEVEVRDEAVLEKNNGVDEKDV